MVWRAYVDFSTYAHFGKILHATERKMTCRS